MNYQEAVAQLVDDRREEIESDLRAARNEYDRARSMSADALRRVEGFEALLAFGRQYGVDPSEVAGKLTLHEAMRTVLRDAPMQMMRAIDLATEIERRRLYRMRDGRPVEAQQIHARVGNYPEDFEREGTFIRVKSKRD